MTGVCRHCIVGFPSIADEICEGRDPRHTDGRVIALATALSEDVHGVKLTEEDERIGWFLDDAAHLSHFFDPIPEEWRVDVDANAELVTVNDRPFDLVFAEKSGEPCHRPHVERCPDCDEEVANPGLCNACAEIVGGGALKPADFDPVLGFMTGEGGGRD